MTIKMEDNQIRLLGIALLIGLEVGMILGAFAIIVGIKEGNWQDSGYHYMQPCANVITIDLNTSNADCTELALQSNKYFNSILINELDNDYEVILNGNRVGGCIK